MVTVGLGSFPIELSIQVLNCLKNIYKSSMGMSVYERKKLALKEAKKSFPAYVARYDALDIANTAIDAYISVTSEIKVCSGIGGEICTNVISSRNKTGLCRRCYVRKYRKKDEQKRLDALRQRYYRRRKK